MLLQTDQRGGTISGNAATSNVSAFGRCDFYYRYTDTGNLTNTFVMSGGTISNNKAGYGGAVSAYAADNYWHGNTSIQLSGNAQIKDNIARNYGGAICLFKALMRRIIPTQPYNDRRHDFRQQSKLCRWRCVSLCPWRPDVYDRRQHPRE